MTNIYINIWSIHKSGRVAADELTGRKIPVTKSFVEKAGGIFLFGVGALAVGIGTLFLSTLAEGFVSGRPRDVTGGVGLGHSIAAAGVTVEASAYGGAPGIEDAADASAKIAAAKSFEGDGGSGKVGRTNGWQRSRSDDDSAGTRYRRWIG